MLQRLRLLFYSKLALTALSATGCTTHAQRIDREAQQAGLARSVVQGDAFHHVVYERHEPAATAASTLTVFIEGDGIPWRGGRVPAQDPTTGKPLALELMIRSHGPAIYLSRPCYHELHDPTCSTQVWTFARYSTPVVDSMVKAIEAKRIELDVQNVQFIGYSGGGVLAVLIAERMRNVSAVVTIAANLDVEAWSEHHGYLPLHASLDPARSTYAHPWKEVHLQGTHDQTVPIASTQHYFDRFTAARRITLENYDHACCWVGEWHVLQRRIRGEVQ